MSSIAVPEIVGAVEEVATNQATTLVFYYQVPEPPGGGGGRIILGYRDIRSSLPLEVVQIDLVTGEVFIQDGPVAREVPGEAGQRIGDTLYIGVEGHIMTVDLTKPLSSSISFEEFAGERNPFSCATTPDRSTVWFGSSTGRSFVAVDVASGQQTDYGPADPSYDVPEPYVYSIAATDQVVIGALGKQDWRLAVLDVSAGTYDVYFAGGGDTSGAAFYAGDGHLWYRRTLADGSYAHYRIEGTSPVVKTAAEFTAAGPGVPNGDVFWKGSQSPLSSFPTEFDFAGVEPGADGRVTLRWRSDEADPWSVAEWNVRVRPFDLRRCVSTSVGVLCVPETYSPASLFASGSYARVGRIPLSAYASCPTDAGDAVVCGYPSVGFIYDVDAPWTLDPYNYDWYDVETNPLYLLAPGKYCTSVASAGDLVVMGGSWSRDKYGSELDLYSLSTQALLTAYEDTSLTNDPTLTKIAAVAASDDGSNIRALACITRPDNFADAVVHVYSSGGALERTLVLLPGQPLGGNMTSLPGGDVIYASGSTLIRFTPASGAVVWSSELPTSPESRPAYRAVDGMLYAWLGQRLHRIDPADGEATPLGITTNYRGRLEPHNADGGLYWVNGARLYRVSGSILDAV